MRLPAYSWRQFGGDLMGGAIAAFIALPYGLAMANLMGLPPVLGIYTSVLTAPVTFLLGRNPALIGGTASVTVPFLAAAVAASGVGGAAKVTLLAAIFMMVFSVFRLGRYLNRVPMPVVSGFSCGIGAMMVITQLKTIFGLPSPPGGWSESTAAQLWQLAGLAQRVQWHPALLAAVVIGCGLFVQSRSRRLPAPLLGVTAATILAVAVGWTEGKVGPIAANLPDFVAFTWAPADVFAVIPAAFGLALVSSANLLVTSRVVYHFTGQRRAMKRADADSELAAYGVANLAAGAFGAPMSVGIPARSLANVRCGGTTRMANLLHALVLALILYSGARLVAVIPLAALAAVIAWIGWQLFDWGTWRRLSLMPAREAGAFLSTVLAVQFTSAVAALGIGCLFYLAPHAQRQFDAWAAWQIRRAYHPAFE